MGEKVVKVIGTEGQGHRIVHRQRHNVRRFAVEDHLLTCSDSAMSNSQAGMNRPVTREMNDAV